MSGFSGAFPLVPEEIVGPDAMMELSARAVDPPMAEIYRSVPTTKIRKHIHKCPE